MNDHLERQIGDLLFLALENEISQEQITLLNNLIKNEPERIRFAVHYLQINSVLKFHRVSAGLEHQAAQKMKDADLFSDLFTQMAEYEKTAPEVEICRNAPGAELIQKVIYPPKPETRLSRFNVFVFLNTAAIVLLFLFLRFAPSRHSVQVATLTDTVNAVWADELQNGARLSTGNEMLLLRRGFAELKFDNNARVTIEGPAEFQILDEDMIKLNYGQLYSHVPAEAYGFQVSTRHAKIIDLGTEFGVKEGLDGGTEIHVLNGGINLISSVSGNKINIDLEAGTARKLNGATGELREIACRNDLFARQIESDMNIVWRGQNIVDLADIVGGGNGFGTGRLNFGVMIDTGSLSSSPLFIGDYNVHYKAGGNVFRPVAGSPAIDGVFVPDGETGAVAVSSQGHLFQECPNTSSTWCVPIINGARYKSDSDVQFRIGAHVYGTDERPGLFLHANAGITYDLNVIRRMLPDGKMFNRFVSTGAVLDSSRFGEPGIADVWVLVDGQVRFSKTNATASEIFEINVPLKDQDSFLSLVVTDGVDDKSDARRNKDGFDWFLFGTPGLPLE